MRAALDADRTAHGVYAWWLINSRALPAVPTTAHPVEPFGLIYHAEGGAEGLGQVGHARRRDGPEPQDVDPELASPATTAASGTPRRPADPGPPRPPGVPGGPAGPR